MTGRIPDAFAGTGWRNCETRSYHFKKHHTVVVDAEARLIETTGSRLERGQTGPMTGREEQLELFKLSMQRWESQELQRLDSV
jgi:hypothetical protein